MYDQEILFFLKYKEAPCSYTFLGPILTDIIYPLFLTLEDLLFSLEVQQKTFRVRKL